MKKKKFILNKQTDGGFKEFEHLESKDSPAMCKAIQELINLCKPPPPVFPVQQKKEVNRKPQGLFGDLKSYFG